jgi:hypothetical protein
MLRVFLPCVSLHPSTRPARAVIRRGLRPSPYWACLQQQPPPLLRRGGTRGSLGGLRRLRSPRFYGSQALQLWQMRFVRPIERNLCHLFYPYDAGSARDLGWGPRDGRHPPEEPRRGDWGTSEFRRGKGHGGAVEWVGRQDRGGVPRNLVVARWRNHPATGTSLMRAS